MNVADSTLQFPHALVRSGWARTDPLLTDYYDTEWGEIISDEAGLFERLTLECFQSGLSWLTILRRRAGFRAAFAGFDATQVSLWDAEKIEALMGDAEIIRNRRKISGAITNAQAVVRLRSAPQTFPELVWSHLPKRSPAPHTDADVPAQSVESVALARSLKKVGFTGVGPTNMFALMAAVGMVDIHLISSHRRGCSGLWNRDGSRSATPTPFALSA